MITKRRKNDFQNWCQRDKRQKWNKQKQADNKGETMTLKIDANEKTGKVTQQS